MLQREILVTGAAGYVGAVLCRQLLDAGFRVRGLDVLLFGDAGIEAIREHAHFSLMEGDLCEANVRQAALKDVFAVVHLAAIVGDPACKQFPAQATALMDVASRALFEAAEAAGVERFVFASTCSNYGLMGADACLTEDSPLQPQSHYARLKVGFEEFLQAKMASGSRVNVSILRFATAYGLSPRMRFDLTVNHFSRDLFLGRALLVFGQAQWRPYCHVQDIAKAIATCIQGEAAQVAGIFNVGQSQENYTKQMIVDAILEVIPEGKVEYGQQTDVDPRNYRVSFDKAADRLQFQPHFTVPMGIQEIVAALAENGIPEPFSKLYENC